MVFFIRRYKSASVYEEELKMEGESDRDSSLTISTLEVREVRENLKLPYKNSNDREERGDEERQNRDDELRKQ